MHKKTEQHPGCNELDGQRTGDVKWDRVVRGRPEIQCGWSTSCTDQKLVTLILHNFLFLVSGTSSLWEKGA